MGEWIKCPPHTQHTVPQVNTTITICCELVYFVPHRSFEPVHALMMSEGTSKVYKMKQGPQGVWVTFRSSSVVCLFDVVHYVKLLQINYSTLLPSQPTDREVHT